VLNELIVENYAVVERVRIRFHPGFNLLTGETGSGKSIVVDALGLLFGGRASADMIRAGTERARISGLFEAPAELPESIEAGEGELIVEREILANGKSRAFVNSRPVAISLLRELAPLLGDIHGQHDQQRLFEPAQQLELLDLFGGVDRAEAAEPFARWRAATAELEALEAQEREREKLTDLWLFQKKEIESANLSAREDETLEQEKRLLANVSKLTQAAAEAYAALYDSPESSLTGLKLAIRRTDDLCRIEGSLQETLDAMRAAELSLVEASYALRDYLDRLEADPARLEQVESRLAALDKLKRKYGPTLADVLAHLATVSQSLDQAENAGERAAMLRSRRDAAGRDFEKAARRLTQARQQAAAQLEQAIRGELKPLAMERAHLKIEIEEAPWSATGADRIAFLISPNLGEEPRPMERVLSGGELSRLALALKCLTSGGPPGRTLVFDEVDAGIGGAVAEAVGRRLKQVAAANQVLCVTHLAQIAGFGDHHYSVEKVEERGRTVARVEELDRTARIRELGRMLAGHRLTPEALKHAEQLLAE
jgi:DNA repair protein RecN (Recombination protein N)